MIGNRRQFWSPIAIARISGLYRPLLLRLGPILQGIRLLILARSPRAVFCRIISLETIQKNKFIISLSCPMELSSECETIKPMLNTATNFDQPFLKSVPIIRARQKWICPLQDGFTHPMAWVQLMGVACTHLDHWLNFSPQWWGL